MVGQDRRGHTSARAHTKARQRVVDKVPYLCQPPSCIRVRLSTQAAFDMAGAEPAMVVQLAQRFLPNTGEAFSLTRRVLFSVYDFHVEQRRQCH